MGGEGKKGKGVCGQDKVKTLYISNI
jgi:hypothetical protein